MKLAIVGSRTFNDYELLRKSIDEIPNISEIVSGGAIGTDKLAERYAKEHNIKLRVFYPDWTKYEKKAGFIRNKLLIDYSDKVIVFWNGFSKGSEMDISIASEQKKLLKIINFT